LPLGPLGNPEWYGWTPVQSKPKKTEYRLRHGSPRHFGRSTQTVVEVDGNLLDDQSLASKKGYAGHEKTIAIGVHRLDQTRRNAAQPDSTKRSRMLGYREPQNQAGKAVSHQAQKTPPALVVGSSAGAEPGTHRNVGACAGVQCSEKAHHILWVVGQVCIQCDKAQIAVHPSIEPPELMCGPDAELARSDYNMNPWLGRGNRTQILSSAVGGAVVHKQ
jgi:hypothetical protein